MMRDFLDFMPHIFKGVYLVRHILFLLLFILLLCSLLLITAEGLPVGDALYLTAITGLSIGYGDITPTTTLGRIVCVVIGFVGVTYVGIVVALVTRALTQAVEEKRRHGKAPPSD